jgi:hypothetical protein
MRAEGAERQEHGRSDCKANAKTANAKTPNTQAAGGGFRHFEDSLTL